MENMEQLISTPTPSADADKETIEGQMGMALGSNTEGGKQGEDTSPLLLGKFKDIEALEKAYVSLQSDYTKKCQMLSQMDKDSSPMQDSEQDVGKDEKNDKVDFSSLTKEDKESILQEYIFSSPELKDKFLAKYFDELSLPTSPHLISSDRGSRPITTPRSRPRTLKEAGQMAEEVLKDKPNQP